ncbi:MAG: ubiquinol-cytochrome c reductase iron-sulfur subunit [Planctomycetes bacterium]|nr:ubiquinol-cytochrome c reductase iron-sulfur subunit [Planctomycetota bacterium]
MSRAALGVGWVAFGSGLGISLGPALGRFLTPNALEEPDTQVRIGNMRRLRDLKSGDVVEDFKPLGIWIIRDPHSIAALSTTCTHLGCIPNWLPREGRFKCPCHGSGFDQTGINFEGPAPRPLERFRIYVEGGVVIVDKGTRYRHELGEWDNPESYLEV